MRLLKTGSRRYGQQAERQCLLQRPDPAGSSRKDIDTQIRKYLELFEKIQNVYEVQSELEWLNIEAIKLAFADMKKQQGYDAAKYEPLFNELLSLSKKGLTPFIKTTHRRWQMPARH